MKRFQCSYVAQDRPQSLEILAKDPEAAVCVAVEKLSGTDYRRLELSDDQGMIYFRQGPSRCVPSFRKFVTPQRPYIVRGGFDPRPAAETPQNANHDHHRLAS